MNFPVLAVGRGKVNIEIVPSIVCFHFFIPSIVNTVEYSSGEDLGIRGGEIMCFTNCDATLF